MEWKQAIPAFRKALTQRLKKDGFLYLGQNTWERPYGHWRGHFSIEIAPANRGQSRKIFLSVSLMRSVRMSAGELLELGDRPMVGYVTYYVYTISYPGRGLTEDIVDSAEDLGLFAEEAIRRLDADWLSWMAATAEEQGDSLAGVYRQTHVVHGSLMYVP